MFAFRVVVAKNPLALEAIASRAMSLLLVWMGSAQSVEWPLRVPLIRLGALLARWGVTKEAT